MAKFHALQDYSGDRPEGKGVVNREMRYAARGDRPENLVLSLVTSILLHSVLFLGSDYWMRAFVPKQELSEPIPIEYVDVPPNETNKPPETSRRATKNSVAGGEAKPERPISTAKSASPTAPKTSTASEPSAVFLPERMQQKAESPNPAPQKLQPKPQKIAVAPTPKLPEPEPAPTAVAPTPNPLAQKLRQRVVTPTPPEPEPAPTAVAPTPNPLAQKLRQRAVTPTPKLPEPEPALTSVAPTPNPLAQKLQQRVVTPTPKLPEPEPSPTAIAPTPNPVAQKLRQRAVTPTLPPEPEPSPTSVAPTKPLALKPRQTVIPPATTPSVPKPSPTAVAPTPNPLAQKLRQRAVTPTPPEPQPSPTAVAPTKPLALKPRQTVIPPATTPSVPKPSSTAVAPTPKLPESEPSPTAIAPTTQPPALKPRQTAIAPTTQPATPLTRQGNRGQLAAESSPEQLQNRTNSRSPQGTQRVAPSSSQTQPTSSRKLSRVQPSSKSGPASRLGGPISLSNRDLGSNNLAALPNSNRLNQSIDGIDARQDADMGPYLQKLQEQVRQQWIPGLTQSSRRTVLQFTVSRSGLVSNLRVAQTSGFNVTDEAALSAVNRAVPFAPFPTAYTENYINITFTFNINIYGNLELRSGGQ
ncbi:hypothetical protein BZZ01_22995 [Nostocales cyanobacterium HT-58-2]|nr:hypothetical protein BZZ01_22995 [Nostocales cyanobacterium HT-58-2]